MTEFSRSQKLRILFVDDDLLVLEALTHLLSHERGRWEMTFVPGGNAALTVLCEREFDVLVTDLCMPETDGIAVLAAAKSRAPRMTRVVLTGSDVECSKLDAFAVLLKPVNVDDLRALLEDIPSTRD